MVKINNNLKNINRKRAAYAPTDVIRLHASERDVPFSDIMMNKFKERISDMDIRLYPNVDLAYQLLERYTGYQKQNLTLFDGSDRAIRNCIQAFSNPGTKLVSTEPSFPMYRIYAEIYGLEYTPVHYTSAEFPSDELLHQIDEHTSIVIISNPVSPVGNLLTRDYLMSVLDLCVKHDCLLVVDEAYIDFSENATSLSNDAIKQDNLIVIRSLSKGPGSAGVRIGYTVSCEENKTTIDKLTAMNEITAPSIIWLGVLAEHQDEITEYCKSVIVNRQLLLDFCQKNGLDFIPSQTNFVHVSELSIPENVEYKTCQFSWSNSTYARLSIPCYKTVNNLLNA